MGIQDLFVAIRKYCRQCFRCEKLSAFKRRRFALDASNLLYKDICSSGANWLDTMMRRLLKLRKNRITPIMIFDGQAPPEKTREKERRKNEKEKLRGRIRIFEERLEYLNSLSEDELANFEKSLRADVDDELTIEDFSNTSDKDTPIKKHAKIPIEQMTRKQVINKIQSLKKQDVQITEEHIKTLKELVTYLGFPWVHAEGEAEELASQLCIEGKVCAVVSEDSDVLAHGCPILIRHIRSEDEECEVIILREVLDGLNMTYESFVDFCIMCGNDYNDRITGVGVVGCYKLITAYNNIDKLEKCIKSGRTNDENKLIKKITDNGGIEKYQHHRGRELFMKKNSKNMESLPEMKIGKVDYKNIGKFIVVNNCDVMLQDIRRIWNDVEKEVENEKQI